MGRRAREAFEKEMAKDLSIAEKAVGILVMFGPPAVGFGLPALLLIKRVGGIGCVIAIFTLCPALYMVGLEALFGQLGGFGKKRKNPLADLPRTNITSRTNGERVVVEGIVAVGPSGTVESELTGKAALWSDVSLTTYKPGSRGRTIDQYRTRARAVPFVIRVRKDGSSKAQTSKASESEASDVFEEILVDPTPAEDATLRAAPHQANAVLNGPGSPRVRKLLQSENLLEPDAGAEASETSLLEGDRVVVIGTVRRPDSAAYRGTSSVCLAAGDEDDLVVTGERLEEVVSSRAPSRGLAIAGVITLTVAVGGMLFDVFAHFVLHTY